MASTAIAADKAPETPKYDAVMAGMATAPDKTSQLEASMVVSGRVSVNAAGAVSAYSLDQDGKLPPPVRDLLRSVLPTFAFEPVLRDGTARPVEAKMSLQLVARRIDADHYDLRLRSARFTDIADVAAQAWDPATKPSISQRPRMHYPEAALNAGVTGTVYLALRFDRSGHVTDVEVSQVNLRVDDPPMQMNRWREMFAESAMAGARKLELHVPTSGPNAGDAAITGILPVSYVINGMRPPGYGEWDFFVRGPVQDIAWMHGSKDAADSSETVPDGQFAVSGDSLRLLTPLGGG